MAGLDYLQAMIDGSLPPPPMGQLMRFDIVSAEPSRAGPGFRECLGLGLFGLILNFLLQSSLTISFNSIIYFA